MLKLEAPARVDRCAPVFAALGDRTRLDLVSRLSDGEALSISALAHDSHLTRQAVTKHLRVLEDVGLVASRKVGRESRFVLRREPLSAAEAHLREIAALWDQSIARLRAHVDSAPD